jgi:hypothetical protein
MDTINQHEFESKDSTNCKHCGTSRLDIAAGSPCFWRAKPSTPNRPRVSAMDDIDGINARIQELREEQAKALAADPK